MFVVVVVWFCRSSSLAFLISAYLINLMHHFLLHWVICFVDYFLFIHHFFLKNTWIFCVFLSIPHLVDNYAKIVDERGRNLMSNRTLPSRLVFLKMIWPTVLKKVASVQSSLIEEKHRHVFCRNQLWIYCCSLVVLSGDTFFQVDLNYRSSFGFWFIDSAK